MCNYIYRSVSLSTHKILKGLLRLPPKKVNTCQVAVAFCAISAFFRSSCLCRTSKRHAKQLRRSCRCASCACACALRSWSRWSSSKCCCAARSARLDALTCRHKSKQLDLEVHKRKEFDETRNQITVVWLNLDS